MMDNQLPQSVNNIATYSSDFGKSQRALSARAPLQRRLLLHIYCLCCLSISFAFAQTNHDQNIARLRQTVGSAPFDPVTWTNLGQAYLDAYRDNGERPEFLNLAYESFWEAVQIDYANAEAQFGLGLTEFERGDYQAALFSFNQLTTLYPARFDGHYNKAVALAQLRMHAEAAEAFQEALAQAEPEASEAERINAWIGVGGQHKALEDYGKAMDAYKSALEDFSEHPDLTYLYAEAHFLNGTGAQALPELNAIEAIENDYRFSLLVADIYLQEQQIDYARRALERARRTAIENTRPEAEAQVLIKLGLLERDMGRTAAAIRAFEAATTLDTSAWQAFYNLGIAYFENGQPESSLAPLQTALDLKPDSAEIYLVAATVFDQLNRPTETLRFSEFAFALIDLTDEANANIIADIMFVSGRALFKLERYEEALAMLEEVALSDAENGDVQLWLGLTQYQLGAFDQAISHYERAAEINEDSIEARVNLGAAYLSAKRYNDAELVYQYLIDTIGPDPEAYYNLGWALLLQLEFEQAKEAWLISMELGYQPARSALSEYF